MRRTRGCIVPIVIVALAGLVHASETCSWKDWRKRRALSFELERGGFGCVVELDHNATADSDPAFTAYLGSMRGTTQRKLASYSDRWVYSQKIMVNAGERTSLAVPPPTPPAGGPLIFVPRGRFWFNVSGVQIEGRDALGADVQYVQSRKSTKLARTNQ